MSNSESGLQYDELGFLIGHKQTGRDVAKIDKNVEQIRDILRGLHKELEHQYSTKSIQPKPKLSALEQALINAQIKPVELDDLIKDKANPFVQSTVVLDRVAKTLEELIAESDAPNRTENKINQTKPRAVEISSTEDLVREFGNSERKRDENGRFVGSSKESQSTVRKVAQTLGAAIKDVMPSNPQGVDPTLDAINEVSTVLSPVKRAAGFMLRPLTGFMKSRKRNEPLQKEQADHNKKQVKLLQRIADNLQSKGGLLGGIGKLLGAGGGIVGSLLGSLGGLFKKGGKGLSKILKFGKGLPVIGALLTAMSFSDWGSQTTKEKGGTVGSLAGGLAGGALGSIFGPVGTIAGAAIGSWVGEKLGGIVAPYVKEWTDSLINADIPSTIKKGWDGFIDLVSKAFNVSPVGAAIEVGKSAVDWIKEKVGGGKFNPSDLLRKQYGGSGLNESNPVKFGDASKAIEAREKAKASVSYKSKYFTPEKAAKISEVANKIGVDPNDLAAIISFETAGTFSPKARNRNSSATGLIQFMGKGASKKKNYNNGTYYGMARDQFSALSFDEQMSYVEKYYKDRGFDGKTKRSVADAYTAVTGYGYKRGSEEYRLNKVWDSNEDGYIDKGEMVQNTKFKVHQRKYFDNNAVSNAAVNHNSETPTTKSAITQQAETMIQKAKHQVSMLSTVSAVTPIATRANSLAASYTPPKLESKIQPAKEYLTSPKPQEVVVKNQNNGTINQNVSNRMLAHAITGGLGMGNKWNV